MRFSAQKAGKRSLFETLAGISTSTQWTPDCVKGLILNLEVIISPCPSLMSPFHVFSFSMN